MTKKEKINLAIVGIIILVIVAGVYWHKYQKSSKDCKENCIYHPESVGILTKKGWNYEDRVFETQKQCIDYCLIKK